MLKVASLNIRHFLSFATALVTNKRMKNDLLVHAVSVRENDVCSGKFRKVDAINEIPDTGDAPVTTAIVEVDTKKRRIVYTQIPRRLGSTSSMNLKLDSNGILR